MRSMLNCFLFVFTFALCLPLVHGQSAPPAQPSCVWVNITAGSVSRLVCIAPKTLAALLGPGPKGDPGEKGEPGAPGQKGDPGPQGPAIAGSACKNDDGSIGLFTVLPDGTCLPVIVTGDIPEN